ncbi:hypothetical protein FLJC2902T_23950 [Flavobacterium limnosediminis JC2902]|uniref:Uncharacterized protein n=1 Tax=Flavobacterium limnosediminis JC2902 TaxID=1341181 RepID=V6SK17_9FLAO|nr:hypothetical protein [Flavobacterium limnosediminis]ESU27053.1 hypothetical protein FLJC2902T_23950 [Flavobacterium limnosediminis JC2902]
MKKGYFAFIVFLFCVQNIQSQLRFYLGKPDFDNATVLLTNGQTLVGEVQDFNSPNAVEIDNPFVMTMSATEELELNLNLDRKKIKFRKSKNDSFRLIPSDSIDVIQFFDEELNKKAEFKRLKITKSVNGEIKETNRTLFLPIFKKDLINLYGYHFYSNGQYATTIFYLNNPKDNSAISPYDIRFVELFSARKKFIERIISSYKFVSGNCPGFHQWLDEKFYDETDEAVKKEFKQYYNTTRKEIKEGQKNLKTKEEKKEFEQQKWAEYYIKTFTPAIEKYKELCK